MKKGVLHKGLKDQPWNIAPVCFLGNLILHLKTPLITEILQMDIVFQNMDLISNRKKASLLINAGLEKLHKISDKACQLFLSF